jgi:DNA-binding transcriptional regulator of glucitol operon
MSPLGFFGLGVAVAAIAAVVIVALLRRERRKQTALEVEVVRVETDAKLAAEQEKFRQERDRLERMADDEVWAEHLRNRAARKQSD